MTLTLARSASIRHTASATNGCNADDDVLVRRERRLGRFVAEGGETSTRPAVQFGAKSRHRSRGSILVACAITPVSAIRRRLGGADLAAHSAPQTAFASSTPADARAARLAGAASAKHPQAAAATAWAWARHHAASRRRKAISRQRGDARIEAGFCSTRWAHSSNSRARAR